MTTRPDASPRPLVEEAAALVRVSAEAASALMAGDIGRYLELIVHADDYTLMSPFGGPPIRGFVDFAEQRAEMARFFRRGTATLEVAQTCASEDLVVVAMVERLRAEVGGLPEQDWPLRVTQVYRREGSRWTLAHRHADPMGHPIGLARAAAIARG